MMPPLITSAFREVFGYFYYVVTHPAAAVGYLIFMILFFGFFSTIAKKRHF